MQKLTLLDYVQDILSDISGDDVTSIFDTVESEQVAQIVKSTYLSLMTGKNWPHQKQKIVLEPAFEAGDSPTRVKLPDNVKELVLINYDTSRTSGRKMYTEMRWKENDDFLRKSNSLNNEESNVKTVTDQSGVEYFIRTDVPPTSFTSFDDVHIIFDSYDGTIDSSINLGKLQVIAYVLPSWTHSDSFIPDLPAEAVVLLLEEAKARASFRLKQTVDGKSEQEVRRQRQWLSRRDWRVNGGVKYPNYGRGRSHRSYNPYLDKNNVKPT